MNSLEQLHQEYGTAYFALQHNLDPHRPLPTLSNSYLIFPFGVGGTHFAASILAGKNLLTFYLLLQGEHRDRMFCHLYAHKAEIDACLHGSPVWTVSSNSNRARITVELNVNDFDDHGDWQRQHNWIYQQFTRFEEAFCQRLHDLKGTP